MKMSVIDNLLKGDTGKGIAIGIGVAVLAPVAIAVLSGAARPATRAALKSGILLYEKGREKVAEFGEIIEDLTAEARAEMEQSHVAAGGAAAETADTAEHAETGAGTGKSGDK
jgi:hypothetical protein